jgi:uridine phosphorylase
LKSKFGSPAVAMTVDILAGLGVHTIIGVGFCGGLQESIQCGDLVLPLACVRDDGTSARYVAESYPAVSDIESLNRLCTLAKESGYQWHCGLVWSTDAILLETSALVNYWSSFGVSGVDMESGTLFTVARVLGMNAVAVLVASDNPLCGREMEPERLSEGITAAIELSFQFARQSV